MNYNDYHHLYRYVCNDCMIGIELRSETSIPLGKDPLCLCEKTMKMTSYFGPVGVSMYREVIQ